MGNIYDISAWAVNTYYKKHSIVISSSRYYYSLRNHTSGAGIFSSESANWGGTLVDYNGETKPEFIWKPNYGNNHDFTPKIKEIKFGDGYEQSLRDGINNDLFKLDLIFNGRDLDEYAAIVQFLYVRKGTESFIYTHIPPFNKRKRYKCKNFSASDIFFGNYSVRATFEEAVV